MRPENTGIWIIRQEIQVRCSVGIRSENTLFFRIGPTRSERPDWDSGWLSFQPPVQVRSFSSKDMTDQGWYNRLMVKAGDSSCKITHINKDEPSSGYCLSDTAADSGLSSIHFPTAIIYTRVVSPLPGVGAASSKEPTPTIHTVPPWFSRESHSWNSHRKRHPSLLCYLWQDKEEDLIRENIHRDPRCRMEFL